VIGQLAVADASVLFHNDSVFLKDARSGFFHCPSPPATDQLRSGHQRREIMKTLHAVGLALCAGFGVGAIAVQTLHAQGTPPAYVVIEADASDPAGYVKEYAPAGGKAVMAGGGKFVVRGGRTESIDGDPPKSRTVVVQFESMEKAIATFRGAEYREARKIGDKYAKFRIWAAEGVSQ
jgi:uncharacterized protein (DUF1330 family)